MQGYDTIRYDTMGVDLGAVKSCSYGDIVYSEAHIDFVMAVKFGCSNKGKPAVIYEISSTSRTATTCVEQLHGVVAYISE